MGEIALPARPDPQSSPPSSSAMSRNEVVPNSAGGDSETTPSNPPPVKPERHKNKKGPPKPPQPYNQVKEASDFGLLKCSIGVQAGLCTQLIILYTTYDVKVGQKGYFIQCFLPAATKLKNGHFEARVHSKRVSGLHRDLLIETSTSHPL